jgi:WhiB family transcriptional regulator, redox-sensing transcriptional regulator
MTFVTRRTYAALRRKQLLATVSTLVYAECSHDELLGSPGPTVHVNKFTNSWRRPPPVALSYSYTADWDAEDWRHQAACRDTAPEMFFPVGSTGPALSQIEMAKAICRSCEVLSPCLEFALATNQEAGVWGGTSEDERRRLRKQWLAARRRLKAEATAAAS